MRAVFERKWCRPENVLHPERPIEMWKFRPTEGEFPFEIGFQGLGLDGQKDQPVFVGKVFGGGFGGLTCGRKMDIAIGDVNWRALCDALGLKVGPFMGPKYLVNQHGSVMPLRRVWVKLWRGKQVLSDPHGVRVLGDRFATHGPFGA